jgi:hypothetical protein
MEKTEFEEVAPTMDEVENALERHDGHMHSIWKLDESEKAEFQAMTEKFNGLVRVFVHPFYENYYEKGSGGKILKRSETPWHKDFSDEHKDKLSRLKAMQDVLIKFLESDKEDTPPIIVFEERIFLREFIMELSKRAKNIKNNIYLVQTVVGRATPKVDDKEEYTNLEAGRNWHMLNDVLSEMGVKKALIAGGYLELDSEFSDYYDRCVGGAVRGLNLDFDVEISGLTYPHSRMDDNRNSGSLKRKEK